MSDDLVGPESNLVEEVDEAVAVGAEEGELTSTADEFRRQTPPFAGPRFGEACSETHKTARAPTCQACGNVRNFARWRCDERGIRCAGELIDRTKVSNVCGRRTLRMNAPH